MAIGLTFMVIGSTRLAAGGTVIRPHTARQSPAVDGSCRQALVRAVRGDTVDVVPALCWRVGPITLGMTEIAVEQALGKPARRRVGKRGVDALYVFPARSEPFDTNERSRFRLALLRYVDGKLALIADDPPTMGGIISAHCAKKDPMRGVVSDAGTGPLLRFAGIAVGDRVTRLAEVFGRKASRNRSYDWYNYLPVPMSFDVGPNAERVTGFAIARDQETLTSNWPSVGIEASYDPATCILQTVHFRLGD